MWYFWRTNFGELPGFYTFPMTINDLCAHSKNRTLQTKRLQQELQFPIKNFFCPNEIDTKFMWLFSFSPLLFASLVFIRGQGVIGNQKEKPIEGQNHLMPRHKSTKNHIGWFTLALDLAFLDWSNPSWRYCQEFISGGDERSVCIYCTSTMSVYRGSAQVHVTIFAKQKRRSGNLFRARGMLPIINWRATLAAILWKATVSDVRRDARKCVDIWSSLETACSVFGNIFA